MSGREGERRERWGGGRGTIKGVLVSATIHQTLTVYLPQTYRQYEWESEGERDKYSVLYAVYSQNDIRFGVYSGVAEKHRYTCCVSRCVYISSKELESHNGGKHGSEVKAKACCQKTIPALLTNCSHKCVVWTSNKALHFWELRFTKAQSGTLFAGEPNILSGTEKIHCNLECQYWMILQHPGVHSRTAFLKF